MKALYSNVQAVLFDLDGTLLDTADDLGSALNLVLKQNNLPEVGANHYRPIASDGAKGLLELGFKEQLAAYNFDELRASFLHYYEKNIAIHTKLYDGISALLSSLNERNISWGIVTNKPHYLTDLLLPHYPEFNACSVMVGGDTLPQRKPHPAPILYACEKMDVSPEHCLYVGDHIRDIEAGNAASTTSIVANWGYIKESDNVNNWLADHICETPAQILSII